MRLTHTALVALGLAALGAPSCASPAPGSSQPELAAPTTEAEIVAQPSTNALDAPSPARPRLTAAAALSPDAPRPPPAFSLRRSTGKAGDPIEIVFAEPLFAPEGRQVCIAIVPASAHDSEDGEWHCLEQGATHDELPTTVAGTFEIRLYGLYPEYERRIFQRKIVTLK